MPKTIFTKSSFFGKKPLALLLLISFVFVVILFREYIRTVYPHLVTPLLYYFMPMSMGVLFTLLLTPIFIFTAHKINAVDRKNFDLAIDKSPTALLGGLAVYLAFLIVLLCFRPWTYQMLGIVIGASLLMIVGVIDDIKPLSSTYRLAVQISASFIVMFSGLIVSFMPKTVWGNALAVIFTLIWILGIVNALNFADGMDGLATGITIIASIIFFLITLHLEQYPVTMMCAVLIGCGIGFLFFNFKKASIYLGDAGSTFLGFCLACFALYGGWSSRGAIIAIGIPILILGVLIFDMIYITISRIKNGKVRTFRQWLDYTGHDHFHHRLVNLGFKEEHAVWFIYITCIILGLSALVLENARVSYPVVVLVFQAGLIFINITILMLVGRKITYVKDAQRNQ